MGIQAEMDGVWSTHWERWEYKSYVAVTWCEYTAFDKWQDNIKTDINEEHGSFDWRDKSLKAFGFYKKTENFMTGWVIVSFWRTLNRRVWIILNLILMCEEGIAVY